MSDPDQGSHRHRSFGRWLLLISVWFVGLLMWLFYTAILIYLYFKILG